MKLKELKENLKWRVARRAMLIAGWSAKFMVKHAEDMPSMSDQFLIKLSNVGLQICESGYTKSEIVNNDHDLSMAVIYILVASYAAALAFMQKHSHDSLISYIKYIYYAEQIHNIYN